MIFHPATLLLAWGTFVAFLQATSVPILIWVAPLSLVLAWVRGRRRTLALLRRTRWLLLAIAVLFAVATPGQRLPGVAGDFGITLDGVALAAEHLLRLLALLASLAVLHERLGTPGMMAGIYWLLAPIVALRALRERLVVRLMLVLDYVEATQFTNWRDWLNGDEHGPDALRLPVASLRIQDWFAMSVLGLLVALAEAFG